jgi:hypothetical protein
LSKVKLSILLAVLALLGLVFSACQPAAGQTQAQSAASATPLISPTAAPSPTAVKYVGTFSVSPGHAPIGATVEATGKGFDPNTDLALVWEGFKGTWQAADGSYNGRDFTEDMQTLEQVKTDASGNFQGTFTVPSGFGFSHNVLVEKQDVVQNQSNFNVDMQVSISPASGPVGTPITFDARGIGWRSLENSWTVIYDNKFTGWMSSVTTDGTAHFSIPAAGAPGKHIIQIIHGSQTFPYMNMQQSPQPDRPSWTFEFTITDGPAVNPPPAQEQSFPLEKGTGNPATSGPALWTDITLGTVGTPVTLYGSGLPAGKQLDLVWFTVQGSRISGNGWVETSGPLGKVTVGNDGTINFPFKVLDDLGGAHRIEAQIDGTKVAETTFTITPSAFAISPSSGPPGTIITLHLKGVGWTETANIYTLVYDNAYVGYACGFNSQGDVTVYLPATGEAGWHYIDLYPGIYKGNEVSGTNNFRIPQLTALEDHPGEHLPVFQFAFQITNSSE